MPSKFVLYRFESIVLLVLFIGAFVVTIQTGNVGWLVPAWLISGIGAFHLGRLKCPNCGNQIMRKQFKHIYMPRQFIPKKCDKCGFDLSKM